MAEVQALGEMSEDEVLDFAGGCAEAARRRILGSDRRVVTAARMASWTFADAV